MKLKSIAAIFKRNKRLIIYNKGMDENRSGTQWISNGVAMYAISGMSILTPENVLTIFDVTPEAKSDWKCTTEELPNFVSLEDDTESESDLEPGKINIEWFGKNYWLFPCGNKIYSVQANYIQPLLDEPDYLTYHARKTVNGSFVLACKIGFELKAIITPRLLEKERGFIAEIEEIASLYTIMRQDEPEKDQDDEAKFEQERL